MCGLAARTRAGSSKTVPAKGEPMLKFSIVLGIGMLFSVTPSADCSADEAGDSRSAYLTIDDIDQYTHGITEIGIERTSCLGICPAYRFIAQSDGTFTYTGISDVDRIGQFTGKISQYRFMKVAQFIAESGYWKMPEDCTAIGIDTPETTTLIVMSGERKRVPDCGIPPPPMLWAIQTLIDDLLETAQWDHPASSPSSEN